MSLATRCTSCTTVFRVVQDQLKVSEGWVRCGRCDAVFNALEGLFDLGREAPPGWDETAPFERTLANNELHAAEAPPEGRVPDDAAAAGATLATRNDADALASMSAPPTTAPVEEEPTPSALDALLADPVDAHLFGPRKRTESAPKPAGQVGARDRLEFSDARFDSDLFAENAEQAEEEQIEAVPTDAAALESTLRPEFLRRAERRARWRRTPVRAALAVASLLALAALLLQFGHHYRDVLAAQWPPLRPVLAAWCGQAGCTLQAPRRIDDMLVESTALTRAPGLEGFVLAINLRNRGALALALPSIDLNLTDGNGRLVARRALAPRDFHAADVLAAGAEAALQVTLATSGLAVAGYTVEIFYP